MRIGVHGPEVVSWGKSNCSQQWSTVDPKWNLNNDQQHHEASDMEVYL